MVVSRSNNSIISLASMSPPIPDHSLNLTTYHGALRWLLNNTAAGIPAPSSAIEYFWSSNEQLSSDFWSSGTRHAFYSLLAYPLWLFNVNNVANPALVDDDSAMTALPAEFHTTASVASPYTKIVVNRAMFVTFVALQSLVLLFAWSVVVVTGWCTNVRIPSLSAYPLFEFAFRTRDASQPSPAPTTTTTTSPGSGGFPDYKSPWQDVLAKLHDRPGGGDDDDVRAVISGARVAFNGEIRTRGKMTSSRRRGTGA